MKKLTQEEFIEKSKIKHNNKYDYSKVNYINNHTKVCIICPIHGEFWQTPHDHKDGGYGCPKCAGNILYSTEEFVKKAESIHNNKYDYSKVEYKNAYTKVCIICPIHGEFWQTPHMHLMGQGCPICNGNIKLTQEEFIKRCKEVHNNRYDYSKTIYKNTNTRICVICPKHGEFFPTALNHLYSGSGCPNCNFSKNENIINSYLKKNNIKFETQKRFETCKAKRTLPFDFYLPDYNLCIEFQGEQHYKPWRKGENVLLKLKTVQEHDKIKKDWCSKEENPNLLEIKYTDNVIKVLNENLKGEK